MKFKAFTLIEAVISIAIILLTLQLVAQVVDLNYRFTHHGNHQKIDNAYFYLKMNQTFNDYDCIKIDQIKSKANQIYLIAEKDNQISRLSLTIKDKTIILKTNDAGYVPVLTEVHQANFCYNIERGFSLDVEDSKKRKSQLLFTLKS
ncbi:competence type IV pilus minor pilin ComGF [Holzapfeliella sp. He02]|uniref:Competence type IV pilus minor pilin ComGF n=1 Tax=Holzapfeliella saturejae TaxID=3082953 RepID=A0ABU8SG10_9LACO